MKKIQIHKVIFTVFLFAIGFTMLTPLLWMISTSFKPENEVFQLYHLYKAKDRRTICHQLVY